MRERDRAASVRTGAETMGGRTATTGATMVAGEFAASLAFLEGLPEADFLTASFASSRIPAATSAGGGAGFSAPMVEGTPVVAEELAAARRRSSAASICSSLHSQSVAKRTGMRTRSPIAGLMESASWFSGLERLFSLPFGRGEDTRASA